MYEYKPIYIGNTCTNKVQEIVHISMQIYVYVSSDNKRTSIRWMTGYRVDNYYKPFFFILWVHVSSKLNLAYSYNMYIVKEIRRILKYNFFSHEMPEFIHWFKVINIFAGCYFHTKRNFQMMPRHVLHAVFSKIWKKRLWKLKKMNTIFLTLNMKFISLASQDFSIF